MEAQEEEMEGTAEGTGIPAAPAAVVAVAGTSK
jgi:hypothetical protein